MVLRERKFTSDKNEEKHFQEPLYVIKFSKNCVKATVNWIIELLEREQQNGGAELLVRSSDDNDNIIIEIDASPLRLLEAAEMMEIVKEDKYGSKREFSYRNMDVFLKPGLDEQNILTTSEKQRIILNEIMNLHLVDMGEVRGYPSIKLYPGQSVIQVCKDNEIITQIFPLHEPQELLRLKKMWYTFPFKPQPLDDIREYFGEAIGFYFAFLGFYTKALVYPCVLAFLQYIVTIDVIPSYICFAASKMIWLTIFLECWKRKSNALAFSWGTLKNVTLPQLHPTFRGYTLDIDPVTKKNIPYYPGFRRQLKIYCVSVPILALCLILATVVMLVYFQVEDIVVEIHKGSCAFSSWILVQIPGIMYAIMVLIMSRLFSKLATFLTEWENHKTQDSYDNHRIGKLLIFEFVNNFVSLCYVAFYRQDMELLKWQIGIMMIVFQLINQVQEAILPLIIQKCSCVFKKKKNAHVDPKWKRVLEESELWPYEGTYDDYLEMFIQFGYVFLFSSIYPLAALLALLNNISEVWADGFKLCTVYQRPKVRPVKGIGIWQMAFEILGIISVMTNCALICLSPAVQSLTSHMPPCSWIFLAVALEHIIIALKLIISYSISDTPKWVMTKILKARYESLQAFKMERNTKFKDMPHDEDEKKNL